MAISATASDPIGQIMAFTKELAGIDLSEAKRSMVEARLSKRLRELGIDLTRYVERVQTDTAEQVRLLDLLTTNHTAWLREPKHFQDLAERVIPWVAKHQAKESRPKLRIWCAAAATGEEPWTLAMTTLGALPDPDRWDAALLATDISTRALAIGKAGRYDESKISALSPQQRQLAVEQVEPATYQVRPALRRIVSFARLNLMHEWPMKGPFDAIFCRNVMIYFDRPTQERLVNRMAALLRPGGTLYVGHSESLSAIKHPLKSLIPAAYVA